MEYFMARMVQCVKLGKEAEGLARQMEAHFFGGGADAAQGYVPPTN
jgi:Fe-S cluster biosynthesis and repair protein YggX